MFGIFSKLFKKNSKAHLENKTILYIDDNEHHRRFFEKVLNKRNFKVILSSDGESGLSLAREKKPDLILLDIVLPGMSGIDVCKILKREEETKNIPIIFLTGMDTPKNLIDCYEYGAEDFLNKSVSPKLLISQIELTLQEYSLDANGQ